MQEKMINILAIGWYGATNIGDELLLHTLIQWARELGGKVTAISVNPHATTTEHHIPSVSYFDFVEIARAMSSADLFVMGGGGIFQDYGPLSLPALYAPDANDIASYARPFYMARQFHAPTLIWAHGVGPLRSVEARELVRDVFDVADSVSVRDGASADLLRQCGVTRTITVAPDPTWATVLQVPNLDAESESLARFAGRRKLALVVREWPHTPHWEARLLEALRESLDPTWVLVWVGFQSAEVGSGITSDRPLLERLSADPGLSDRSMVLDGMHFGEALRILSQCDAVLAMRLHAAIASLSLGKPTICYEYDEKIGYAAESANVPSEFRIKLDDPVTKLKEALARITVTDLGLPEAHQGRLLDVAMQARGHRRVLHEAMQSIRQEPAPRWRSLDFDWLGAWRETAAFRMGVSEGLRLGAGLQNSKNRAPTDGAEMSVVRLATRIRELDNDLTEKTRAIHDSERDNAALKQTIVEYERDRAERERHMAILLEDQRRYQAEKEGYIATLLDDHRRYRAEKEGYIAALLDDQRRRKAWLLGVPEMVYFLRVSLGKFVRVARSEGLLKALNYSWLELRRYAGLMRTGTPIGAVDKDEARQTFNPYELIEAIKPLRVEVSDRTYAADVGIRFSCVTTVKNEAAGISSFLASIAAQSLPPEELIIVDGGSTDETVRLTEQMAANCPFPVKIICAGQVNIAMGRNIGIEAANCETVLLVDAGCRLGDGFIANMIGVYADFPSADLVAGIYAPMNPHPVASRFIFDWAGAVDWQRFLPSARAICVRKELWKRAGGFPEYLTQTGEDTLFDLNYRRLSRLWVINRHACVLWDAPITIETADKLAYRYGYGDGESGFGDFSNHPAWIRALEVGSIDEMLPHVKGYIAGRRHRAAIEVERRKIAGVILMLSGVPFTDSGGGQRCSQLAMAYARRNFKVFFVNIYPSFEERRKLFFDIDYTLFEFFSLQDFKVEELIDRYAPYRAITITALLEFPHPAFMPIVLAMREHLGERAKVVYDYIDNWRSSLGWEWYSEDMEMTVASDADYLMASAGTLKEDLEQRTGRKVSLVLNAVNDRLFDANRQYPRPADLPLGGPVVVYTGALWGEWFDWDLLGYCADQIPKAQFVLIGGFDKKRVESVASGRGNVHFLGLKPQAELPAYLSCASVCIIPFKVDHITHYVNPLKVYEYLAMHKPVVVTRMVELKGLPGVMAASSDMEFVAAIKSCISTNQLENCAIAEFVLANNWESRVNDVNLMLSSQSDRFAFPVATLDQLKPQGGRYLDRLRGWGGVLDATELERQVPKLVQDLLKRNAIHEPDYRIVRAFGNLGDLCVDIGANMGQSIISMKAVNPTLTIESFEPNPLLHLALEQVARQFQDVAVHPFGLGDCETSLSLYTPAIGGRLLITPLSSTDPSALATETQRRYILDLAAGAPVSLLKQEIRIVVGDDLELRPTFMKIDVEGAELSVVRGFARTIEKHRPLLMIEKPAARLGELAAYLRSLGYQLYRYDHVQHALNRLKQDSGALDSSLEELPLNIFYVHVSKAGELERRGVSIID